MKYKVAEGTAEELPTTTTHVTIVTMLVLPKREHPQRSRLITTLICLTAVRILELPELPVRVCHPQTAMPLRLAQDWPPKCTCPHPRQARKQHLEDSPVNDSGPVDDDALAAA